MRFAWHLADPRETAKLDVGHHPCKAPDHDFFEHEVLETPLLNLF